MNRKQIITGISLLTLAGVVVYLRRRHRIHRINELKAEQVSEQGYETAHDILFPQKRRSRKFRLDRG